MRLSRLVTLQVFLIIYFISRRKISGVIGAIDCCNIPIKAPKDQQESYIDRKSRHSIKLQAIATADKMFTNIMVGFPGSVHDSRVSFKVSDGI